MGSYAIVVSVFMEFLAVRCSWYERSRALPSPQKEDHQSRLQLLRTVRDCLEIKRKRRISQAVKRQAAYYFGSLDKAIVALKRDQRFLSGWSKPKIIKILSRMHRSEKNLAYANMRHKFPALLSAAEAHFGNWGKALYAAGIDPKEYFVRRDWHQRKK